LDSTVRYQKSVEVNKHIFSADHNYMYLDFFLQSQFCLRVYGLFLWIWNWRTVVMVKYFILLLWKWKMKLFSF